jgi:hypothetical protein
MLLSSDSDGIESLSSGTWVFGGASSDGTIGDAGVEAGYKVRRAALVAAFRCLAESSQQHRGKHCKTTMKDARGGLLTALSVAIHRH